MSAPWPSLIPTAIALAICGLGGLAYGAVVIHRARRQADYKPVWEDWLWYAILPCSTYAALAMAASLLFGRRQLAGSIIGGLRETQEMLDFCADHGITADVEVIPIQKINEALDRLAKGDMKYRFVVDMASLR